jgi:large subunit ribosomal protein L16
MGKGKGAVKYWVALVQKSQIFFEIKGLKRQIIKKTLDSAHIKLPIKTASFSKF